MEFKFLVSGEVHKVSIEFKGGRYLISLGDRKVEVDSKLISSNCLSLLMGNQAHVIYFAENKEKKYIAIKGERFCLQETHAVSEGRAPEATDVAENRRVIAAPMPGRVVKVLVSHGQRVVKNQNLVIVEAMKMENEMRSPMDGLVEKIHVSAGDLVEAGEPMVELVAS